MTKPLYPKVDHFIPPHCGFYAFVNAILLLPASVQKNVLITLSKYNEKNQEHPIIFQTKSGKHNLNQSDQMHHLLESNQSLIDGGFISCCVSMLKQLLTTTHHQRLQMLREDKNSTICWFKDSYVTEAISHVMLIKGKPELLHNVDLENRNIAVSKDLEFAIQEKANQWTVPAGMDRIPARQACALILLKDDNIASGLSKLIDELSPLSQSPNMATDLDLCLLGCLLELKVTIFNADKPYKDPRIEDYPDLIPEELTAMEQYKNEIVLHFSGAAANGHWACGVPAEGDDRVVDAIKNTRLIPPAHPLKTKIKPSQPQGGHSGNQWDSKQDNPKPPAPVLSSKPNASPLEIIHQLLISSKAYENYLLRNSPANKASEKKKRAHTDKLNAIFYIITQLDNLYKKHCGEDIELSFNQAGMENKLKEIEKRRDSNFVSDIFWKLVDLFRERIFKKPKTTMGIVGAPLAQNISFFLKNKVSESHQIELNNNNPSF